ncbi:MAG TPA: hypothetical protein PLP34_10790, partial [Chitinophagaceae bacterium]|nr:hypothetical protein [Chitinophagaceae bacterium]
VKWFSGILIIIHLIASCGIQLEVHQCGRQKTYSWLGISFGKTCRCDHRNEKHTNKCCKEKKIEIKGKKEPNRIVKSFYARSISDAAFPDPVPFYTTHFIPFHNHDLTISLPERPPECSPPLYLRYQVFRI